MQCTEFLNNAARRASALLGAGARLPRNNTPRLKSTSPKADISTGRESAWFFPPHSGSGHRIGGTRRSMAIRAMLCSILLFLAPVEALAAAVIKGIVHLPRSRSTAGGALNPYPGRANSLPEATPVGRGAVADAVIYIDGSVPAMEDSLSHSNSVSGPPRLAQKGQAFQPRVLAIRAGTTVDFPNLDPIYHNVFSVSPTKRFDLGKYGKGRSKRITFDKPGRVNVYCDIHSDMEGFVIVLPHAWFAQPDSNGAFALPPLPAGKYRLKAWHPDFGEREISVDLAANEGRTVDIEY